ncbi:putative membrane protein [Metarhizium anisopliae]|nr:putative membrane protein [Metarhizium anisopliae]
MPIINRLLHITNFKSPLLRTIVPSVGAALAVQLAAGLPSVLASTERFFDISGSLTFLAVGALSLYLPHLRGRAGNATLSRLSASWNWRQVVVTGMAMAWSARLGAYLFRRISQDGHDPRFDTLRTKPLRFASAFFMQAVWVSVMLMPVMAVNAVPAAAFAAVPRLAVTDVLGIGVWAGGIALETAADVQKSRWVEGRRKKEHDEQFLKTGLFGMCRFPHYFGEISLWTGLATTCAGVLALKPIQLALGFRTPAGIVATTALSFVAPAFSGLLLTKVSGIPLTEARHDEKYGGRADYQEWKRNTPKLVPKLW